MIFFKILISSVLLNKFSSNDPAKIYIEKYQQIAVKEMKRKGIPASIKLAQALLESENGKSSLAINANNHFGIKCGKDWQGEIYYKIDDEVNEIGDTIKSCFRVFLSVEESYKAHSDFLTDEKKIKRYGFLFELNKHDYKAWANGLKQAGYATDPEYPNKLIRIIEKYELFKLDVYNDNQNNNVEVSINKDLLEKENHTSKLKLEKESINQKPEFNSLKINEKKAIQILNKTTVELLAKTLGKRPSELIAYNEILYAPLQLIEPNTIIFIEKKKNDYIGNQSTHVVKVGETLESIANIYGVRVQTLQSLNRIQKYYQPLVGEKINLKDKVKNELKPKTIKIEPKERFLFEI